jgi:replicative DNA helicase
MIEELDLRILKSITNDKVNALTFAYKYDSSLFDDDVKRFGQLTLDYIKHYRSPPTKRTLLDRHKGNQNIVDIINETWDEVEEYDYDLKEYQYDLSCLKRRYQERAVDQIRELASQDDPDNPKDPESYFNALSLAINRVTSLDLERSFVQKPVGDYVDEFSESYNIRKENPESSIEIKTHFSMVDCLTGGCAPGELWMIGGESNSGKSMKLNALGKQMWMNGNTIDSKKFTKGNSVLYFSLEMPYRDCFIRFLASLANVPQKSLVKSELSKEEKDRVEQAYDFIKRYQEDGNYFEIVDSPRGATIQEIELRYNDALLRYRPDIVVIDYMTLMESSSMSKEQDWLKWGAVAGSLHEFARAYDCVVITASQLTDLNRQQTGKSSDEAKRVGMHRWGRSSLIMHHVNVGIQIETRPQEKRLPDMKVHIIKNRKGPLGQGSLIKNFANASLVDVPFNENEVQGDVSASIPDLIRKIQLEKANEAI